MHGQLPKPVQPTASQRVLRQRFRQPRLHCQRSRFMPKPSSIRVGARAEDEIQCIRGVREVHGGFDGD